MESRREPAGGVGRNRTVERTNERKVSWPVYEDAVHIYANQNTNFEKKRKKNLVSLWE